MCRVVSFNPSRYFQDITLLKLKGKALANLGQSVSPWELRAYKEVPLWDFFKTSVDLKPKVRALADLGKLVIPDSAEGKNPCSVYRVLWVWTLQKSYKMSDGLKWNVQTLTNLSKSAYTCQVCRGSWVWALWDSLLDISWQKLQVRGLAKMSRNVCRVRAECLLTVL